jgi:hypothetical protein
VRASSALDAVETLITTSNGRVRPRIGGTSQCSKGCGMSDDLAAGDGHDMADIGKARAQRCGR